MGTTYIIPCGAEKLPHAAKARDLYIGSMFGHTLAAVEAEALPGDRILVLSAKHGLLELDDTVAPYDVRMGEAGSVTTDELAAQAEAVGLDWQSDVYAFLPRAYFVVLDAAMRSFDCYPHDVYEATIGIGEHRKVNRCVREHSSLIL